MPLSATDALPSLHADLARLRRGELTAHAFSARARDNAPLLAALPARYAEVLHGLLDRLESGALFSEESCSFSQKDLIDSLQMWLDKAGAALPPQG